MEKELFGIPIEHMEEDPLPLELRERLLKSIVDIYESREGWLEKEPERAKWWRQLSYFNEKGESIRKSLMRTPIDGARLSSGFVIALTRIFEDRIKEGKAECTELRSLV